MKIIENLEQGTLEWHKARRAMVTGTCLEDVMGSDYSKLMLICELIAEEETEQSKQFKVSAEMERGNTEEVFARKHFENKTGKKVTELGFCISDEFPFLGCSGDGWIKNGKIYDEAVEVKSPDTRNAVFYRLASILPAEELGLGSWSKPTKIEPEPVFKLSAKAPYFGIPADYKWQVVNYFIVNTDLKKLHFLVWDPRFPNDETKMHTITVTREMMLPAITEAREELVKFKIFWDKCRKSIISDNF